MPQERCQARSTAVMQRCEAAHVVPTSQELRVERVLSQDRPIHGSHPLDDTYGVAPLLRMGPPPIELDQVRSQATLSERRTSPTSKP